MPRLNKSECICTHEVCTALECTHWRGCFPLLPLHRRLLPLLLLGPTPGQLLQRRNPRLFPPGCLILL